MSTTEQILGAADATHTPTSDTQRVPVHLSICDKQVPPAAQTILGQCEYYYQPLHNEYIDKSGVATWQALKAWATRWNPFDDVTVFQRLLANRDALIAANSTHGDWSRHANFMLRHIGCEHTPPDYYVSYGYYYCSTYGERLRPRLSEAGQRWLAAARLKLQENLEEGLDDNMNGDQIDVPCNEFPNRSLVMSVTQYELEVTNETFKTFAFRTHVPAYLDAGLADLPIPDLARIGGQPNIEEWLDGETWQQAWDSGTAVAGTKAMRVVEAVGDAAQAVGDTAQAAGDAVQTGIDTAGQAVGQALESLTRHLR